GQFAAGHELAQGAARGLVELGKLAVDGIVLLERVGHQRFGINRGNRSDFNADLHGSLSTSSVTVDGFVGLAPRLFLALGLPTIMLLLAACQSDFALGDAVAKIDSQRNYCEALLLRLAGKFGDLVLVQKQLAGPQRRMVERPSGQVR